VEFLRNCPYYSTVKAPVILDCNPILDTCQAIKSYLYDNSDSNTPAQRAGTNSLFPTPAGNQERTESKAYFRVESDVFYNESERIFPINWTSIFDLNPIYTADAVDLFKGTRHLAVSHSSWMMWVWLCEDADIERNLDRLTEMTELEILTVVLEAESADNYHQGISKEMAEVVKEVNEDMVGLRKRFRVGSVLN